MTAADVLTPLQAALYARLTGDAALMADISGVYDGPREGTAYPYVVLGEVIETADNALGQFGSESLVTLHVWSRAQGFKEGLE